MFNPVSLETINLEISDIKNDKQQGMVSNVNSGKFLIITWYLYSN